MAKRIIPVSVLMLSSLAVAFAPCKAQQASSPPVAGISSQASAATFDNSRQSQSIPNTSLEIVPRAQALPGGGNTIEIPAGQTFSPKASVRDLNWTLTELGLSVRPATISYFENPQVSCPLYGRHIIRDQVRRSGVEVLEVTPERPAAKGGLRGRSQGKDSSLVRLVSWLTPTRVLGDFVVEADGKPVQTPDDLSSILSKHKSPDPLRLSVVRVEPTGGMNTVTVAVPMTPSSYSLAVAVR